MFSVRHTLRYCPFAYQFVIKIANAHDVVIDINIINNYDRLLSLLLISFLKDYYPFFFTVLTALQLKFYIFLCRCLSDLLHFPEFITKV